MNFTHFQSHPKVHETMLMTMLSEEMPLLVQQALAEDFRCGPDLTSLSIIAATDTATASFVARQAGVVCGIECAITAFEYNQNDDNETTFIRHCSDGDVIAAGEKILTVTGNTRVILATERTALNFLTHLSGIATYTRQWVNEIANTSAQIRDTRKTLPGLRIMEKYAVNCGGGINHRFGLGDAILIKDNHIRAAGSIESAYEKALAAAQKYRVSLEVEVDDLEQLDAMLAVGAELILLDNFPLWQTQVAVNRRNAHANDQGKRSLLESSGGITFDSVRDYAACGVDYIAIGALTHSSTALDIGLDFY